MTDDQIFIVGEILPRIAAVSVHKDFQVTVTWEEGSRAGQSDVVDLGPTIMTYRLYAPLRDDPIFFQTVHVIHHGSALGWGDGEDIDMSAEGVEDLAEQAMTASDFRAFMERHEFTREAAAAQLGISRRQVDHYLTSKSIPRTVALACAYLDIGTNTGPRSSSDQETELGIEPESNTHPTIFTETIYNDDTHGGELHLVSSVESIGEHKILIASIDGDISVVTPGHVTSGKADLTSLAASKPVTVKP